MNNPLLMKLCCQQKIKGGALYYTVLLSFIITGILSAILYMNYLGNRSVDISVMNDKLQRNVRSGIQLFVSDPSIAEYNKKTTVKLFEDDGDSISLTRIPWGGYDVIISGAKWRRYEYYRTALTGAQYDEYPTALYMADENKYLTVGGNTFIRGTCYLPKLGIRRGVIEGKFFKYEKEIQGTIDNSSKDLPEHTNNIAEFVKKYLTRPDSETDSLVLFSELRSAKISKTFLEQTLVIYDKGAISLRNIELSGNIVVIAEKKINVFTSARLKNIILISPEIFFENEFKGQLQAFASDSLVLGTNVHLEFPSVIGLVNNNINTAYIILYEKSLIAGGIVLFQSNKPVKPSVVQIDEKVKIYGTVYCEGIVEHKGEIYGSLYCRGFVLKTKSAYYDNHLLDAVIDFKGLPESYAGFNIFTNQKTMNVIDWLD